MEKNEDDIPEGWIPWKQAHEDFRLKLDEARKIRIQHKVPIARDSRSTIFVDPIAWDQAVADHFNAQQARTKK